MNSEILEPVRDNLKHWYLPLILGIVLIVIGVWVFLTPLASYVALSILFAVTFLITGILEIVYAVSNSKVQGSNWGWSLAGGIIDFLIGLLLIALPQTAMVFLSFYVGFGIMFRSGMAIGRAIDLKRLNVPGWGYLLSLGILGLLFSFVLIWNPLFAGLTIVFYTALAFISLGIFQVILAFRLKKLRGLVQPGK
jgi:uncharacterized membrane protein HdeD (DUF308 family)